MKKHRHRRRRHCPPVICWRSLAFYLTLGLVLVAGAAAHAAAPYGHVVYNANDPIPYDELMPGEKYAVDHALNKHGTERRGMYTVKGKATLPWVGLGGIQEFWSCEHGGPTPPPLTNKRGEVIFLCTSGN